MTPPEVIRPKVSSRSFLSGRRHARRWLGPVVALVLLGACRARASEAVSITEFMADNTVTLADEDGAYEDWIEIQNQGVVTVDLGGWSLTDEASKLAKWTFPATNLPPGAYLVVFASNKNRRTPGAPLHTNFKLSSGGEFLALVDPAGKITSSFAPRFPAQVPDVSFGFGQELRFRTNLTLGAVGRWLIPTNDALGTNWTFPDFDDGPWTAATNGIGYDTHVSEIYVGGAATAILTSAPVAYWRLDETTGTVAVNRGTLGPTANGTYYNGAVQGVPGPRPDPYNGFEPENLAAHFDGVDDKVDTLYQPALNPPRFTVECWARVTGGSGQYRSPLTSRADGPQRGYLFYATPGDAWEFWTGSGSGWNTIGGARVVYNQWIHLAGSYDGATMRLFTNGVQVAAASVPFRTNDLAPTRIGGGATEGPGTYFFNGDVDEAAIFGRALSASEILAHFQVATNAVGGAFATNTGPSHFAGLIQTDVQAAMWNRSPGAFLRLPFVITNLSEVNRLMLRLKYDDGFVAYLNGVEAAAANAPTNLSWSASATGRRDNAAAAQFETFNLEDALPALRLGTNILALRGLNFGATNADFLLLAELETTTIVAAGTNAGYFAVATPAQPNGSANALIGPIIQEPASAPLSPLSTHALLVTARVRPAFAPLGTNEVLLSYRVMFGATNTLTMFDDGAHGDGAAGDGLFGATIPAGAAGPGQMIRWFITATDTLNRASRWPLFPDPLNSPEYLGTMVQDPTVVSQLPVWCWFALDPAAGRTRTGTRGAVFFRGEFYDNVFVRDRGGYTVYGSQKFDFNTGYHLNVNDEIGRVQEANLNSNGADPSYTRPLICFEVYRAAGAPASAAFPLLMRLNGGPDRVGLFIEQVDERFLDRWGFDRLGALYKFDQRAQLTPAFSDVTDGVQKKTRQNEDASDLQAVVDAMLLTNNIEARAAFMFDHFNLPNLINFFAARAVIRNVDCVRKNFYLHRDTRGTGEWSLFPWDMDLTWGSGGDLNHEVHPFHGDVAHRWLNPDQWNWMWEALFNDPRTRPMILRRMRSVMDQQLGPVGYLEGRASAWFAPAFATLGTAVSNELTVFQGDIASRRAELYGSYAATNAAAGVNAIIPQSQPPNVVVKIAAVEFNPSSGNQAEEYICLSNPAPFAVDISGWRLDGAVRHVFYPGTVLRSNDLLFVSPDVVAFRNRASSPHGGQRLFVQGNYQGQLSARGETLRLFDSWGRLAQAFESPGAPSLPQQYLRVTELMYHPDLSEELEFIELKNISTNQPLDLAGVRLVNGIEFDLGGGAVRSLGPGETVLVVKNLALFTARYGAGFTNIAGQYTGSLDNAGERLQLLDARNEEILDFSYSDQWYPITDGPGFSLVIQDESAPPERWNERSQWRPSARVGGSPGAADPSPLVLPPILVNEVLADSALPSLLPGLELFNPTPDEVNVGGWRLTDDFANPHKYILPAGTHLAGLGYHVFAATDLLAAGTGVALNPGGGHAYLFSADENGSLTGYVHGLDYGPTEAGGATGRWVTSDGLEHFPAQIEPTLGTANLGPRLGPVIINEIMYHPPDAGTNDNVADEFIELLNVTTNSIALYDPSAPTNAWRIRGGVDFDFPTNLALVAGEFVLLVSFNPADLTLAGSFRAKYGVPANVRLFGPYSGKLDNSEDKVELHKPVILPGATVGYVEVDMVHYHDASPWPKGADGYGLSLQRRVGPGYGNEPTNWVAAIPTAATATRGGTPPVILDPPLSQVVLGAQDTRFNVGAAGAPPLRYQWRCNGASLPGATNSILLLTNAQPAQTGDYEVLVYNDAGSIVSPTATLAVLSGPTILQPPRTVSVRIPPDPSAAPSTNATFVVQASSGSSLRYQWRQNGVNLPGATNSSLTISNVKAADWGEYVVAVTDDVGTVLTPAAWLYPLVRPMNFAGPVSLKVVVGSPVTMSSEFYAWPPPFTNEWRRGSLILPGVVQSNLTSFHQFTAPNVVTSILVRLVVKNAASSGVATPTATLSTLADTDGDGMPDAWETACGLSPTNALDRLADADGDGFLNWQEWLAGTDPTNARSLLNLRWVLLSNGVDLRFEAVSNLTYTLQSTDSLGATNWNRLADFGARSNSYTAHALDTLVATNRFYRLVTPRQP